MMDLSHIIETVLTSTVPLGLYMWNNRRIAKQESQKKHVENQDLLSEIKSNLEDHPPHHHIERGSMPLTAAGIRPDVS